MRNKPTKQTAGKGNTNVLHLWQGKSCLLRVSLGYKPLIHRYKNLA